jgi:hypothetical protein
MCDSDIHPVKYVLTAGIQQWFTDPTIGFVPLIHKFPSHHHPVLFQAVSEQQQIGWQQAILDFLGQSWHLATSVEMFHPTPSNASRGDSTLTMILQCLHPTTRELWLSRNRCLHDHSDQVAIDIQSMEAAEIRHFHSQPYLLPIGDQHYCKRSLNTLLCSSKAVRGCWLKHIWQARANKLRHGLLQTNISHFFIADKTPRIDLPPSGGSPLPPPPSGIGQGRVKVRPLQKFCYVVNFYN